jgi:hypothetical protein
MCRSDFVLVCKNGSCSIEVNQVAAFIWIYFQITVDNLSCLNNPIHGLVLARSTGFFHLITNLEIFLLKISFRMFISCE